MDLSSNGDATMTKHTHETNNFGRKVAGCPRCEELANGSAPREGWQKGYFARKAAFSRQVEPRHSCAASGCGPVCTFGEW